MLSNATITTVKSTVPLLEQHGLAITQRFYQHLFEQTPALKNIFNQSNQRDSSQAQALTAAILAYANNIDNLAALLPTVQRIANKHASIGIQANHYPLVGQSLLHAIQEVLSLPSEHPALAAWAEAYGVLADVFIQAEADLYQSSAKTAGGWQGFRPFTISAIKQETPEVKSFTLEPVDKQTLAPFQAGQYVSVKVPANDTCEHEQIRQYSLSDWQAGAPTHYRITIKAESPGKVSTGLHKLRLGDTIHLSAPYGDFQLKPTASKHVFIAGGVGITPLFAMLQQTIAQGLNHKQLTFIHCYRNTDQQIYAQALAQLAANNAMVLHQAIEYGDNGDWSGRLNEDILQQWIPDTEVDVYFCGPLPFMSALKSLLEGIGVASEQLHYEVFGPTTAL